MQTTLRPAAATADAAYARNDMAAAVTAFGRLDVRTLSAPRLLHYAHALALTGELARAERLAMDHIARFDGTAEGYTLAAGIALERGDFGRSLSLAAVAEQLGAGSPATRIAFAALCRIGALPEAMAALGRLTRSDAPAYTEVNDLSALCGLTGLFDAIQPLLDRLPPPGAAQGAPRLLVAMPKSAGATIAASIAARCDASFTGIGADLPDWAGFPAPWLHPGLLRYFAGRQVMLLSVRPESC